jgi:antitoxin HigA-1
MKSLRNKDRKPSSPGEVIRDMILPDLGITQTEFAKRLGVSRRTINEILNGRRPVTADMAIRFSRSIGSSADFWLRMQQTVDLWNLERSNKAKYAGIKQIRVSEELRAS